MNNFLKTRNEINLATRYLQQHGLSGSGIDAKNWEMVQVIPFLKDGELLDMGSDGSIVIENAILLGLKGTKVGIDLAYEKDTVMEDGTHYIKGSLMETPFENEAFDIITCLSVIEHEVDFKKFAKEVNRLLSPNGNAFVSFDYWTPKPEYEKRKLYNLDWNILDVYDVNDLVVQFAENGMRLTTEIDWTTQDAVINSTYCSPVIGVEYTFGILHFIKS